MRSEQRLDRKPLLAALLVSAVSFLVYFTTLAPGLDFIDSGELSTDVYTLGICHPTGYPLFSLVGFLFSHLPIASSIIFRLNMMAALCTALGAGGVVLLMSELLEHWLTWNKTQKKRSQQKPANKRKGEEKIKSALPKSAPPKSAPQKNVEMEQGNAWSRPVLLASIAAGLAAAFSATWWEQSTSIEVYPLHLLLIPLVLSFFLRMLRLTGDTSDRLTRDAVLFAVFLGLAFTNHMTTVFLAPACLVLYFVKRGFGKESWLLIAKLALPFLAVLLLYLYLPLRASQSPMMDWGHPTTLGAFFRHLRGGQYSIWMFQGSARTQWDYFWHRVPIEYTLLGIPLMLVGIFAQLRANEFKAFIFNALLFLGCLLAAINYGIHDIDSYFLLAYLALALWIGCGIFYLMSLVPSRERAMLLGVGVTVLFVAFAIYSNYAEDDESGNHMVDDYVHNLLSNLPPHAIIFSTQWDFWLSGAYYYQLIEKYRPDVLVIDKAMLHDRAWYYRYLDQRAPDVMSKVKNEETGFLRYLRPFDNGDPFDQEAIGPAYNQFMTALIQRNLDRPIFATSEVLGDKTDPFLQVLTPVPVGISFRMLPPGQTAEPEIPKILWHDERYKRRNYYTDKSRELQATPLAATAQRLLTEGRLAEALSYADLAARFAPVESMEGLAGRDSETAIEVNEQFLEIERLRARIKELMNAASQPKPEHQ